MSLKAMEAFVLLTGLGLGLDSNNSEASDAMDVETLSPGKTIFTK
jgi:hypothetical protein